MGEDAEGGTAVGVFRECSVAFVSSASLAPKLISNLSKILEEEGATVLEPRRDGSLRIDRASHIVSNSIDFPQYTEAQAYMIPVVTTQWITTSIMRRRQAQLRPFSPDPRMIFAEVVVTCADLPLMDKESILGATMALGGQASKDATRLTTHICALAMDHPKIEVARARGWKGKVVLPHWFDDCFKLGKRIDEGPYLLPDPEILQKRPDDDLDIPSNENLVGASSTNPAFPPLGEDGAASRRRPVTVFLDKRILLGADLLINPRLHKIIEGIIVDGGGRLVDDVDACDTLICQYRAGEQYVRAARACKEVGNMAWLYHLIVHNEWISPMRRLLHYPVPRDGLPEFKGLRITVSNYGGEARTYLENLITACGAEFTKTMKADNTHLVTARDSSEKCKAAPEWGIAVVNHLWIEESYAKCALQHINVGKYNHFPPRTNLGEVIGQTFLDEPRLRELYYPGGEENMSAQARRKRRILDRAEENAYPHGPAVGVAIGELDREGDVTMHDNDDNDDEEDEEDEDGNGEDDENQPPAGKGSKGILDKGKVKAKAKQKAAARGKRDLDTPIRTPRGKELENDTPSVASAGGRSAKAKARDKLQSIAPDIALYEREKKRGKAGGAPFGGKRAASLAEKENEMRSSPSRSGEADDARPSKKARSSLPVVEMRIIVTGWSRWVENQQKEDQERRKLRDLGIQIVQEGQPCDYLAAPHVVRTVKFLCALARGPTVISSTFLDEVLEAGELLDVDDYVLRDQESEAKWDMDLAKSVARAKAYKGKLLRGVPVYCTERCPNGPDSYRAIAEANGATFKLYRARSGTTIKPTTAEEDGNAPPEPVYLLSGTSADEKAVWARFRKMAEAGHMEPRVVMPEWLLDVAMAQQVRFKDRFLLEE
ncbi:BRCT-containing protein 1 [Escovopsis weberi]|uniref:BRCT-containing protein 1 n=1 Tax=Escovopsis weberi TaxID=150374 RepID=A0A0M9VS71_ESCWE|nr:BRCT-containing protein 1 [Escovopsis weberi]